MKIFAVAFGLFVIAGCVLIWHGLVHLIIGFGCIILSSQSYGLLAVGIGVAELVLFVARVPCWWISGGSTTITMKRRLDEKEWKVVGYNFPAPDSTRPANWLVAALHSFALAGVYQVCKTLDLFAITL